MLLFCGFFLTPIAVSQSISFARPDPDTPIAISSDSVSRWHSGIYEVFHLRGNVQVAQGNLKANSQEAIVWVEVPGDDVDVESPESAFRVILYLENGATINRGGEETSRISDDSMLERLFTRATVDLHAPKKESANQDSSIYQRAFDRLKANLNASSVGWPSGDSSRIEQVQFEERNPIIVSPRTGETMVAPSAQGLSPQGFSPQDFSSQGFSSPMPSPSSVPSVLDSQQNACLLYTSPSPRDKRQSRMPSSA